MFLSLGRFVTRCWPFLLAGWAVLFTMAAATAPPWNEVAIDGELTHLPADMPTRKGARLHREAFPGDITDSSVVIVAHRSEAPLQSQDRQFVGGPLVKGLEAIAEEYGGLAGTATLLEAMPHEIAEVAEAIASHGVALPDPIEPLAEPPRPTRDPGEAGPRIVSIASLRDPLLGSRLVSEDGHATLVMVGLTSDFLETQNDVVLSDVESLLARLRQQGKVPEGLRIDLSGSATVGTSTIRAVFQGTRAVRRWAIWIAVTLLLVVFRAPVAALIPLATMYVAVEVTLAALAWAAWYDLLSVFDGLKLYVTVIVYGAGVDYSLFLLARQEEELRDGHTVADAVSRSLASVGTAVAASAGTEIAGIGLLATADFGKFQQAGVGIAFGLFVLLIASLTLTPALLCLTRKWAFWPQLLERRRPVKRFSLDWMSAQLWRSIGRMQRRFPGVVFLSAVAVLAPMAVVGGTNLDNLRYGLLAGLPDDWPSVRGLAVVRSHFEPGVTGPITLLVHDEEADFSSREGVRQIADLSGRLRRRADDLQIADLRSLSDPLGRDDRARQTIADLAALVPGETFLDRGQLVVADTTGMSAAEVLFQEAVRELAFDHYVSHTTSHDGRVTRLTLIPTGDPFRLESIQHMDFLEDELHEVLPEELADAELYLLGATASLRDVRDVARSDWRRIRVVIPLGVFLVLLMLLRRPLVSAYLVLTVVFSFLVTYGVTFSLFRALDPAGFAGIDWTVPIFLFTLLVAVGEDYSVLLVTRTEEERRDHTPTRSVTEALVKTGGLISGAGLIMAGTFSALLIGGTLAGMRQLGFALGFGMLLDTFVVRPLLVPSFLDLLARWRLSRRRRLPGGR